MGYGSSQCGWVEAEDPNDDTEEFDASQELPKLDDQSDDDEDDDVAEYENSEDEEEDYESLKAERVEKQILQQNEDPGNKLPYKTTSDQRSQRSSTRGMGVWTVQE